MARTCGELPRSRCERDYNDETETFEPGGCEGAATETVKDTANTPRRFCATITTRSERGTPPRPTMRAAVEALHEATLKVAAVRAAALAAAIGSAR
jgi:hypothetical protein